MAHSEAHRDKKVLPERDGQQLYLPALQSPWWEAHLIDEPARRRGLYQFRGMMWYEYINTLFFNYGLYSEACKLFL